MNPKYTEADYAAYINMLVQNRIKSTRRDLIDVSVKLAGLVAADKERDRLDPDRYVGGGRFGGPPGEYERKEIDRLVERDKFLEGVSALVFEKFIGPNLFPTHE